jgi:hypothetical protein
LGCTEKIFKFGKNILAFSIMASIRDLKKDINYLASEIITEAYVRKMLFNSIDEEEFKSIVLDTINFRNAMIKKVNHPTEKNDRKKVRKYFQEVQKEMYQKFSELVDKVSELKQHS